MIFSPVKNRLNQKVYAGNSLALRRVVIQNSSRVDWLDSGVFMAGNAPGSHINPLLFQLFYAGLLVVGMFNEWSSTFISSEIVHWRYSFKWEMKTKKVNVQSAWRWGGVGVLLATILAGKKMAEFSIGHDYYSFLCWQISFLGLNFECRFDCF